MKTNFIKLGILLFGISLFFFNCEAEDYFVDKENLLFNTTTQKEAQLLFDKHSKKQNKSKNNNVLKIEIDWKDFKQDDLSFTEALLSNVSAKLNVDITYKSRLIFININNKTIKAIETQNIESFDSNGNIQNGMVYYHKFNGTFLIGYQVINGKTEKRLLPKKDINTANFFSFFTLNEDCNEQLNPNNTFCDQQLEGFTITATKSTPPKSSPLYYYILDHPTLEEDSYEDGTKVGGGGSGGGDDNDNEECPDGKIKDKDGKCVNKPCKKNPITGKLEVAPQKGKSKTIGALQGCTRYGGTCTGGTNNRNKNHGGIDIKSSYGNPIYAMYDGFIYSTKYDSDGAGYYTRIQSTVNGKTFIHEYFHLQKDNRVLQRTTLVKVKAGDIIGYQGDSGNLKNAIKNQTVESHVHIEVREHDGSSKWGYKNFKNVDPRTYFSTKIKDDGTSESNTNCN